MGQDFSSGLKPEHAAGHTTMTRAGSDLSLRSGNKSPSLPASPISPRSPIMPRAFHSPTSSPLVGRRSMSPRRGADYGFASAVSNIVDQAHYISEQERLKRFGIGTCCAKCHFSFNSVLTHLSRRLKWAFLIEICPIVCSKHFIFTCISSRTNRLILTKLGTRYSRKRSV